MLCNSIYRAYFLSTETHGKSKVYCAVSHINVVGFYPTRARRSLGVRSPSNNQISMYILFLSVLGLSKLEHTPGPGISKLLHQKLKVGRWMVYSSPPFLCTIMILKLWRLKEFSRGRGGGGSSIEWT